MPASHWGNQDKAAQTLGHVLGKSTEKYGAFSLTQQAEKVGQERGIAGSWLPPSTSACSVGHNHAVCESVTAQADMAQMGLGITGLIRPRS